MIQIVKSASVPQILVDKGAPATTENCRLYTAKPTDYDSGKLKLKIDSTIYRDSIVKKQLMLDQHNKCCFCEADFTANGYGDVEHFRPKAGFKITPTDKLTRPGYYWLAYDWNNLFFSCEICNQKFKGNYFPLEDETKRTKNHTFDYREESPLLLHPSLDNPEDHITFNRHITVAKSKKGETSIKGYGLDNVKLNRDREKHYQYILLSMGYANINLAKTTPQQQRELSRQFKLPWPLLREIIVIAQITINKAADDTQPFAAMVRANFPDLV